MQIFKDSKSNHNSFSSLDIFIQERDIEGLSKLLNTYSSFELADLIASKTPQEQTLIFGVLTEPLAIETFDFLPLQTQKKLLHRLPPTKAASLLNALSPDDRTFFLQKLPSDIIDEFVKLLSPEERVLTRTLLGYPRHSIGRLMTPDYIAVKPDWTVEQVLDHIQDYGHDSETINMIYVVDDENKLLDDIKLKQFLFVPRQTKVHSIADFKFVAISAYEKDKSALNIFKENDLIALPVIDDNGILLGIVTIDDILRLASERATEVIQQIGGTQALDEPYMQVPFLELMKKRAGWLVLLFIGEMFTATAMGYFEDEIAKAIVLALFVPLIISSGGNAGSQASTLVIRAMALKEVKLSDWWKVVKREILSGLFLGTLLGTIGFFRVVLWSFFTNIYGPHSMMIALTLGFSLIGVVLWGTLCGAILPIILRRLGADPATSSAPFVATLVDVTGLVIYFLIAMELLQGTLL